MDQNNNNNNRQPKEESITNIWGALSIAFGAFGFVFLMKKGIQKGRLFYIYLLSYSVLRFINEFLRGDEIRGFVLGISTSQLISILIFIASLSLLIYTNLKKKEEKLSE